jgi:uncharacterized protein (DUF1778 family)
MMGWRSIARHQFAETRRTLAAQQNQVRRQGIVKRATTIYLQGLEWDTPMTASAKRSDYPLSMRLPEADIAVIDRAARLRGRSRTDFVRDAAVRAAEDVLMENTFLRMSQDGFAAFMDAVSAPGAAVPALVEVFKRPAPWDAGRGDTGR